MKNDYLLRSRKLFNETLHSLEEILIRNEEIFFNDYDLNVEEIIAIETPKTLSEALSSTEREFWIEAIEKELGELDERGVFEITEDQEGPGMKSKMFYKFKYDQNLNPVYKARLVACGYSQIYGIDYEETFGPTTTTISFNMIVTIAKIYKYVTITIDIGNAFLEGEMDFDNYMYLPADLSEYITQQKNKRLRVKIILSLYGTKQAAKVFNEKLNKVLIKVGFKRTVSDVCLYVYKDYEGYVYYLLCHIDDIIITGKEKRVIDDIVMRITKEFKRVTTGDFKKYLGIKLDNTENFVMLNQSEYISEFVTEYLGEDAIIGENTKIPMKTNVNFRLLNQNENNISLLPATGKIRYCADKSRPDILFAINLISTQTEKPNDEFVEATIKLMKYLYSTRNECLTLGGKDDELKLFAYSDASYVTDKDSKSQLGNCFFLSRDSGAIYSVSKKDNTVSHSSTEAELKALDLCVRTVLYLRIMLKELCIEQESPTEIFVDNNSAKLLVESLRSSHKTKHINMRINFIREQINERNITIKFVRSENQVADIFTKALPKDLFEKFKKIILTGWNLDEFK